MFLCIVLLFISSHCLLYITAHYVCILYHCVCAFVTLNKKVTYSLTYFSTTSRLNGKYLLNETRYRQSGKGVGKHEVSPTLSQNFMKFGPQTA